jgi:hypothetical protein
MRKVIKEGDPIQQDLLKDTTEEDGQRDGTTLMDKRRSSRRLGDRKDDRLVPSVRSLAIGGTETKEASQMGYKGGGGGGTQGSKDADIY